MPRAAPVTITTAPIRVAIGTPPAVVRRMVACSASTTSTTVHEEAICDVTKSDLYNDVPLQRVGRLVCPSLGHVPGA
jgi:hypothetical protein